MKSNIQVLVLVWKKEVGRLPAETTIRDSHHRKSLIRRTQDLNQRRTCAENLLSEVGKYSKPLHHGGTHIEDLSDFNKENLRQFDENVIEFDGLNTKKKHFPCLL